MLGFFYVGTFKILITAVLIHIFKNTFIFPKRFDERKILLFAGILIMFLGRIALFPIPGLKDIPTRNASIATTTTSIDNENLSLNPLVISYQDEDEVHFDSFTSCKISLIVENYGRNHVHLTARLGFVTQHLWLGDFGKCNRGLRARTLRLHYPKSLVTFP